MNLLIVEDDKNQIQLYQDVIESFNKEYGTKIIAVPILNIKEAKEQLLSADFDAAIVDLKLSPSSADLEGLEIVREIFKSLRFPVFIVSGSIGQVDLEEHALFKKRLRDSDFKVVLKELTDIYHTGITGILGKKGEINEYLHNIFWSHLAGAMDHWVKDAVRTPEQKRKTLLRYTLLHIQEYLDLTEESDFEHYHPAEIYITPTVKKRVFTGDIVMLKENKKNFIVLTPSCDLAQAKAKDILLAEIEGEKAAGLLCDTIRNAKKEGQSGQEAKDDLEKLIKNSYSNKYHFLPRFKDLSAGLINFQKINSLRVRDFNDQYLRLASINGSFTKDIVARFSYYYSRQGSPDFNLKEVYESLMQ